MPLDIVGQHTQKDMSTNPGLQVVMDGTHLKVNRLDGAEGPLDLTQALVATHRVRG